MIELLIVLFAVLIDYKIGDPQCWPHPIIAIGHWIELLEKGLRKIHMANKFGGLILWLLSVAMVITVLTAVLETSKMLHPWLYNALVLYFLFASLAATSLKTEVMKVHKALVENDLKEGRKYLSWLVGRDTETLTEDEVIKGAIETTAENTIDGVLAPLFYILVGMAIGYPVQTVFLYKTVNTLDSMVGYVQAPFKEIGFVSAKLDDLFNLIPARIGSFLMLLAGGILGFDLHGGRKIWRRDCRNHKSPNAGYPESAVAGLLNIQLGGTHTYFGQVLEKPTIGDPIRPVKKDDISNSCKIMYMSEFIFMMMGIALLYIWNGR